MEMRATLVRPKTSAFNGIQALVFAPCSLVPGVIGLDSIDFPCAEMGGWSWCHFSRRSPEPRIPQMVRARCNSPALAFETMPWK
jgi:hypothetical protein